METAASSVLTQDPRTYFAYDACRYCRSTPCRELMHKCHTVYGSRFVVIHNRTYNTRSPCVFASPSWSEIHRTFLCNLAQPDLAQIASRLIANLSVAETNQYSVDAADPTALLERLWKNGVIAFIRVPHQPDEKMRAWLSSWRNAIFAREKREKKAEAVVEAAAEAAVSATGPELMNAKWVHTDETAKKDRPGVAAIGDKILLSVETKNIADGQSLIFKVHNVAGKSARTLESIEAKVNANMAQTEWTVVKDDKQEEMEVEFDAGYGGSVCGRGKIMLPEELVPVILYEYPYAHESKLSPGGISNKLLTDLNEYHTVPLLTATRTGPVLAADKWAYVFAKSGNGVSLIYECKVAAMGDRQTYEFVSWGETDRESSSTTYPRPVKGGSKNELKLKAGRDYYILLSEIQLPVARIDYYTKHKEILEKRSLHIPSKVLKPQKEPITLFLTDYMLIALGLREDYDKHVQSHEKFLTDKDRLERCYLAGLVCAVADSKPRLKGWLNYPAVVKERDSNDQETQARLKGKNAAEAHLRDWKLSEGFTLTREDYNGTKELEEAIIEHEAYLTSEDELKYLENMGENRESWYNRIFEPEGRFIFFRKLETLVSNKDFWELFSKYIVSRYLANFGPTKMKGATTVTVLVQRLERFLGEIDLITDRAKITFPDLLPNKGKWFYVSVEERTKIPFIDYEFRKTGQIEGVTHLDTKNYRSVKRKWNTKIDNVAPSLQKVLIGIEAVNLGNAVYLLSNSRSLEDWGENIVNTIGSTADFLSAFEHIGKSQVEKTFQKAGRSPTVSTKLTKRVFARINLAGAICDYIGALRKTYISTSEKNYGSAAGWATIGLASIASGTSATMAIASSSAALAGTEVAASMTAVFGLGATALGVIGIGLFVAGGVVLWYFEDDDLRDWAKKSTWSNAPEKGDSTTRQIEELHKLICEFSADSYLFENRMRGTESFTADGSVRHKLEYLFTVRVRPGYFNDRASKYLVAIKIVREGGLLGKDRVVLDKTLVLPASSAEKVRNLKGEERTVILHRFTGQELGVTDDYQHDIFTYELTANLDFYGDGTQKLFNVKKKGKLPVLGELDA